MARHPSAAGLGGQRLALSGAGHARQEKTQLAGVILVEVGEQPRLGDGKALPGAFEVGASLVGDQDLARPAVAGVGPAGDPRGPRTPLDDLPLGGRHRRGLLRRRGPEHLQPRPYRRRHPPVHPGPRQGTPGALYHAAAGETPNRWIAERVADDLGCGTRSVDEAEAAHIWGQFDALIMAASSRPRATRSRHDLGWRPHHTDMLTMVGTPRLRAPARPAG